MGEARPSELVDDSGVPQGRIYGVIDDLSASISAVASELENRHCRTDTGPVTVGGWKATFEDVVVRGIEIRRAGPEPVG